MAGIGVVIEACTEPGVGGMTGITFASGLQVRRRFSGSGATVVAAAARLGEARVIKLGSQPGVGGVAVIAFCSGHQVCRRFAFCGTTVVAAAARLGNIGVVKAYCTPGTGVMAVITFTISSHMTGWHAISSETIVAGFAGADDRAMIDLADAAETNCVMTVIAHRSTQNVRGRFANCDIVIVATVTGSSHCAVIEARATPAIHGVAIIAEIAADNVLWVFSRSAAIVMALAAVNRCAFKLASRMAARTINKFMLTCKREASRKMIKTGWSLGGNNCLSDDEQYCG